jgi:glycosidase
MMEFHISRQARERFQFDLGLFSFTGNVILANFHAARLFAHKMNQKRNLVSFPENAIKAGQINAMGMIDEIFHYVFGLYRKQGDPHVLESALDWIQGHIGAKAVEQTLHQFVSEFPPLAVYRRELSVEAYLQDSTEGMSNRAIALEELVMLWLANKNPAFTPYNELFDDLPLQSNSSYLRLLSELHDYFDTQTPFGPDQINLIDMLRSPAISVPYSLSGQLEYIRTRWAELLGRYLYRLLSGIDLIKEEEKLAFFGPGPIPIPVYDHAEMGVIEIENFSPDREWMPRLVLIAKNSYVWLEQLSKKYELPIKHLDQIPDQELDQLARWGFTGLWLIGLWERSSASAQIKQLCGNPEAIASAYSLASYQIAHELGGEESYRILRERAWQRGLRIASDMVPNHMGIDSEWLIEHPNWFISLDYSPFPSYSFSGKDLAPDGRVSIRIEDHYFDRTDAAVVFQRIDHRDGGTQFVYHGNDGTSMPWNDTAQLNYLNPEVREAVIQTILSVARRFPIIRFDAAMTLAKKHYQRLWYPEPGSGGDIPSRANTGMTRDQFDALFPVEFWREVVDRVASEAPDTLLLAEAFWLMEGYFVRTLGMHRVYNSAFMNMLRNEENAKYRLVMKNTLEFDPEILRRFVNFMNNPDERTAVDQFGKGDKYFGICTLLATLPGLPMFGHGQIEGFTEKYGMEFRRAYWDEKVDSHLVGRHERQIFSLLQRRAIFAGVDNFLLYDFYTPEGQVDENVFAYSNGLGEERALVVYHNRFANTTGWVRSSVAFSTRTGSGERVLTQRTLGEGLNIHPDLERFVIFKDQVTGLEYIRRSHELAEQGLYVTLDAYQCHVFMDFRQVQDDPSGSYRQVYEMLNSRGVPSIEEAMQELILQPVQQPFRQIINPGYLDFLLTARLSKKATTLPRQLLEEAKEKILPLLHGVGIISGQGGDITSLASESCRTLGFILSLRILDVLYPMPASRKYPAGVSFLIESLENDRNWLPLFAWAFTHQLGKVVSEAQAEEFSLSWLDEWQLSKTFVSVLQSMSVEDNAARKLNSILRLLVAEQSWFTDWGNKPLKAIVEHWLESSEVQHFIGVNRYNEILWFNHESFEEFVKWISIIPVVKLSEAKTIPASRVVETVLAVHEIAEQLLQAEKASDYRIDRLLNACGEEAGKAI